jgi:hypothetical protein
MEDEIANVEGAFLDVAVVVASDTLQVPCCLDEGGVASFFEPVDVDSSAVFRDAFVLMLHCW